MECRRIINIKNMVPTDECASNQSSCLVYVWLSTDNNEEFYFFTYRGRFPLKTNKIFINHRYLTLMIIGENHIKWFSINIYTRIFKIIQVLELI